MSEKAQYGLVEVSDARHVVVHSEAYAYCAHPHIVIAPDGTWIVVFNRAPRKSFVLHPPEEPFYHNVVIRSGDQGRSWSAPLVVPDYNWSGTECAGLTVLSDGRLMLNQWQFEWLPLEKARRRTNQAGLTYPKEFMKRWQLSPEHSAENLPREMFEYLAPWVRAGGRTFVHFSDDCGMTFGNGVEIDTLPQTGGYGMRGAVELHDGRILLPLSDVPNYRQVFSVESVDAGRSWHPPVTIARGDTHEFEEPALLACKSGKLLLVLRDNATRHLHQAESIDGGLSWTAPVSLPIKGYPAHLLQLDDGRILMTYGWRFPDFGIHAVLSNDEGKTWDIDRTFCIRGAMPNKNVGYPATIATGSGGFFTVYYGEDPNGLTSIHGTSWSLTRYTTAMHVDSPKCA